MAGDTLRQRVRRGDVTAGAMVFEFYTPGIAQIMANAGCEFIVYDMEHTGVSLDTLRYQVAACRGLPVAPMVRPVRGDYRDLAAALDIGMSGLMIPMVESKSHAEAIVEATHYPPQGRRGAAFGFAHDGYKPGSPADKIAKANDETLIIAQIETERGLDAVEDIASVEGIDVLWLGHFDLTNFLGIPGAFDDPRYLEAITRIVEAAKAHGKGLGFMAADTAWASAYRAHGFNMIAAGTDMGLLGAGVQQTVATIRGEP